MKKTFIIFFQKLTLINSIISYQDSIKCCLSMLTRWLSLCFFIFTSLLVLKKSASKIVGSKQSSGQKHFGSKRNVVSKKNFGSKINIWSENKFGSKNIWVWKLIRVQKKWAWKKLWVCYNFILKINFVSKNIWVQ